MPQQLRYTGGLAALLGVVCLWVASSFLISYTFDEETFFKPFLLTYYNTSAFSLYLIPAGLRHAAQQWRHRSQPEMTGSEADPERAATRSTMRSPAASIIASESTPLVSSAPQSSLDYGTPSIKPSASFTSLRTRQRSRSRSPCPPASHLPALVASALADIPESPVSELAPTTALTPSAEDLDPLTARETAKLALQFCILWFLANYLTNASLGLTSVASTTILSSMSGPFTLAIAARTGADTPSLTKALAVALSIGGVVAVSLADSGASGPSALTTGWIASAGDVLALSGALFYALYITFLKLSVQHESRINMPLFFGILGVCNAVLLAPVLVLLHWTGIETFVWPSSQVFMIMTVNAVLGTVVSDYLWMLAMLLTGPVVVTLGLSLTIPVAMVGEALLKHATYSVAYSLGAGLIVLGFIGANLELEGLNSRVAAAWKRLRGSQ
ncbi:hypothetical protein BC828DRAFT_402351 [Blastocladiella britannica]|nr:hypothetical protein BC828DRAFT_402351 [Blastocladiella britannica]